jgi:3-phosphoglycerate kinase
MSKARGKTKLIFPIDFVCAESINHGNVTEICVVGKVPDDLMGLDIGPGTVNQFSEVIQDSGTILWNGPMGVFEVDGFHQGTQKIAERMADVTVNETIPIIGGGESAAAVNKFGLMDKVSHVSTGGGASLELLSGNSLPAIYSLEL